MSREVTLDATDSRERAEATEYDPLPVQGSPDTPEYERGQTLGRYVLLEPIGRGGMGVVWSAYDPELDRRVALKLLRDLGDDKAGARLVREAQAMAKLGHPNVITVHDVGRLEDGVFLAMELVEGVDLRQWQHESHPWSEILAMFIAAGRGLQAAHEAGLVHRDFKPANVLVGDNGDVKVVDFGLARQLEAGLDTEQLTVSGSGNSPPVADDKSDALTRTGAVMGTPAYMAPEQHRRLAIDPRTDQFSYCVALYEGLFGRRPFDGDSRLVLALQTNRGEFLPPPRGHPVPARIARAVLRGLSPEPGDRFPTMSALLAELSFDPQRRNRRVAAGALAVLGLGVGGYGYLRPPADEAPACPDARPSLQGTWDAQQQQRLEQTFGASPLPYAPSTARFVVERLDAWTDDWVDAQRSVCEATVVAQTQTNRVLELRQGCLDRQRKDLAAVTRLLTDADAKTIERADRLVGSLPDPKACADADIEALGRLSPPADPALRQLVEDVRDEFSEIRALEGAGRFAEALEHAQAAETRAAASDVLPLIAEARWWLGTMQAHNGQGEQAMQTLHRAAIAGTEAGHDQVLADIWLDLAWNSGMVGARYDDAMRWADYAEAVISRLGRPDGLRSELLCTRGSILWSKHDPDASLRYSQECLELRVRSDPDSPQVALTHAYVGNTLVDLGRYEEAERSFERGLQISIEAYGEQHPSVASMRNGLGVVYYHQHRLEEAEAQYQKSYDINVALLGPDHVDLLYAQGNIAGCRKERGDLEGALEAMERVEALVEKGFPAVHREVGTTQHNIGEMLALMGRHDEALARYARALPVREEVHGTDDPFVANTLTARGESLLELRRDDEALADFERALKIRDAARDPRQHDYGRTRFGLAQALWRTGGDKPRALRLAEAASGDFESADSALKRQRAEALHAWLGERRPADGP